MSAEQEMPEVQSHQGTPASQDDAQFSGQNSAHGMGQSKSSRRRRRKRKNKGDDGPDDGPQASSGAANIPSLQAGGEQAASTQPQQTFQPRNNFQGGSGQQQQNGSASGKRWKKKFRDRDRQRTPGDNPGNNGGASSNGAGFASNNGGGFRSADTHQPGNNAFKRKGGGGGGGGGGRQQRGPRSFVGPMDHSYRVVNGNFADTPPSTIETSGNGGHYGRPARPNFVSDSQPIDYSQGKTIPIAENAPTRILFFIEDLFFIAKIQETARKLGVKVAFIKNDKEAISALTDAEEADRPGLIVFDLNNASAKPLTLIPKLKTKLKKSTSIVGFLSHIQGDLKAKAMEAGCDTVMPRAAFSQNLPNLLRRYGLEEEEEPNFNQ